MKKRFCALMLLLMLIFTQTFSLTSCGEKYEPVESTDEEKETVINISFEGEKYEVPYELYRAFFLQLKGAVDGGNSELWTGAEKDKYIAMADELIYQRIAEIYAVFHLCEKLDIDVYSGDFDDRVQNVIEVAVDGGTINGTSYEGFGGDYQKYLDSLKKMNLNYSAQELLIRYQLAYEELATYYMGSYTDDSIDANAKPGNIKYTKEDVKEFYYDTENSRKIIIVQLQDAYFTREKAQEKRDKIASLSDEKSVINYVGSLIGTPTVEVIGKHTYDKFYYSELTNAAFSLNTSETSKLITLKTDVFDGYVIVYRLEPTENFFDSDYESILSSYLYNEFGKIVDSASVAIYDSITPTDALKELDRSKVSMGE